MDINFKYDVSTDYNSQDDGNNYSRIVNLGITKICVTGIVATYIKAVFGKHRLSVINQYCIDRLFRIYRAYDLGRYKVDIVGGYYGDEIGSVQFRDIDTVHECVKTMMCHKSIKDKVNYVLEQEYGYLLEDLKGCDYTIKRIPRGQITFGQREYVKKVTRIPDYAENTCLPRGVVLADDNPWANSLYRNVVNPKFDIDKGLYRLIDGYHRCLSCDDKTIRVIVAYEKSKR